MVGKVTIKELAYEDRPREKLKKFGVASLTDKEILAILLGTGNRELNVIELADRVLKDLGGVTNLRYTTFNELIKHKGIGEAKAISILASLEFAKRIFTENINSELTCERPDIVANYLRYKVQELKQEIFIVLDLDTKGKILEEREVFKGSLSSSLVHPREVFKNSIRNSAASVICAHNHPSGDATPSLEDILTTDKLIKVGALIGIDVLDHIIIAKQGYCSLRKVLSYFDEDSLENLTREKLNIIIKKYNLVDRY